jgi:cytochrome c
MTSVSGSSTQLREVSRAVLVAAALLAWSAAPAAAQQAPAHGGPVRAVLPLPGERLASAGFDESVILWDRLGGRALAVLRWHDGAVNALAPLPGGGFASAGEDGRIGLWPADPADAPGRVLAGHEAPIVGLAAGPGGRLGSASWDGTARVWGPDGAARVLEGHRGNVNAIVFRADGVPVTAGFDGTVRAWPEEGAPLLLAEFGLPQNALAALPDGTVAVAAVDGAVRLIGPDGAIRELAQGGRPVVALAASGDGRLLAAASLGGSVALFGLPEGRLRATLEGPGLPVWSAAFDERGQEIWTGGADRRVRRWDAATGRPLGPLGVEMPDLAAAFPGADPHGVRVWQACAACHSLTAEGGNMAGPHLHRLFGRRMGSVEGYRYSERLARGDIVWTAETVAELFTRGPDVVTPGTRMPVQRVDNAEDLAALIRFLEQATR